MIGQVIRNGGWVAIILLVVAAGFGWFANQQGETARSLDDHGVVTTATVEGMTIETRRVRSNNGTRTEADHLVTYTFEVPTASGPGMQRVEHEVPRAEYRELSHGEKVEIRYLPEDPTRADFFPGETQGGARLLGLFAMFFLVVAAGSGWFALWLTGRKQAQGTVAP